AGSLACALLAAQKGAQIIRVHDVQETADVLRVMQAMMNAH
ncbi:MAG: dihydropteroate synthase, partial [Plesiomonas shigelloides]